MYLGLESEYFFIRWNMFILSPKNSEKQLYRYRDIENISTYLTSLLKIQVHS